MRRKIILLTPFIALLLGSGCRSNPVPVTLPESDKHDDLEVSFSNRSRFALQFTVFSMNRASGGYLFDSKSGGTMTTTVPTVPVSPRSPFDGVLVVLYNSQDDLVSTSNLPFTASAVIPVEQIRRSTPIYRRSTDTRDYNVYPVSVTAFDDYVECEYQDQKVKVPYLRQPKFTSFPDLPTSGGPKPTDPRR